METQKIKLEKNCANSIAFFDLRNLNKEDKELFKAISTNDRDDRLDIDRRIKKGIDGIEKTIKRLDEENKEEITKEEFISILKEKGEYELALEFLEERRRLKKEAKDREEEKQREEEEKKKQEKKMNEKWETDKTEAINYFNDKKITKKFIEYDMGEGTDPDFDFSYYQYFVNKEKASKQEADMIKKFKHFLNISNE